MNASVAALATEVKADIENGFGTWKVKLNVNISLFGERVSGKRVDGCGSTQRAKIRENKVGKERWNGRRGMWVAQTKLADIVNGR